jgi:hypothetical protein
MVRHPCVVQAGIWQQPQTLRPFLNHSVPMKNLFLIPAVSLLSLISSLHAGDNPYVGRWALTLEDGRTGWLGVEEHDAAITGSLMWGTGSVLPLSKIEVRGEGLYMERPVASRGGESPTLRVVARRGPTGLALTSSILKLDGTTEQSASATGKDSGPMPEAPDLTKVEFGTGIPLLEGDFSAGWQMVTPGDRNGWSLKEGILSNRVVKDKGKRFGNLRTTGQYEDFRLTTELRTLEGSNSGIYLRGRYEIQIAETFGKPLDSHNMGALYSRIIPAVAAEKPVGEWQKLEITLVNKHVTVVLNGQTLINNQPALGCTGGALESDESKPGPLMLQGDHTDIDYRNMVLQPVKKGD